MILSPELKILIINFVGIAVAYLGIYRNLNPFSIEKVAWGDLAVTLLVLTVAAGLFLGSGIQFSLIFFQTNWFLFSIITLTAMEIPFLLWLLRDQADR